MSEAPRNSFSFDGINSAERSGWQPPEVITAINEASVLATPAGLRARYDSALERYNDLNQVDGESAEPVVGTVVTLDGVSPERQRALFRKMDEYHARFERGHNTDKCETMHPFDALASVSHSAYKAILLKTALVEGSVDVNRMYQALVETGSMFNEEYKSAVFVLSDYINTGGADIAGGTGLQQS